MERFRYRGKNLYLEEIKIEELARRFGTPIYIYSANAILEQYFKLREAFRELNPLICFSSKANFNTAILKLLVNRGAGVDVVSGGELYKALRAGCPAKKIVFAGVGKRDDEIEYALRKEILFFNVESLPELEKINCLAKKLNKLQRICLRLNPDVAPETHNYIVTGKKGSKFGMGYQEVRQIINNSHRYKNVRIEGIHLHIGSQVTKVQPFLKAAKLALRLIQEVKRELKYLNLGGGIGIVYHNEKPFDLEAYAEGLKKLLADKKLKLILEPGRFIVGNAGMLVTKVIYLKKAESKNFVVVDAGMNLLLRPALYSAYHEILPLKKRTGRRMKVDVVGPICESSDYLAQARYLPKLKEGDFLGVMGAGAYGFVMASNYNAHPRAAEVLVDGKMVYLIRRAERYKDLVRYELLPKFLR